MATNRRLFDLSTTDIRNSPTFKSVLLDILKVPNTYTRDYLEDRIDITPEGNLDLDQVDIYISKKPKK